MVLEQLNKCMKKINVETHSHCTQKYLRCTVALNVNAKTVSLLQENVTEKSSPPEVMQRFLRQNTKSTKH